MNLVSNSSVLDVRSQVRQNALEDFSFFANTVLGSKISEDVCEQVQEVVEEQEDTLLLTQYPRALAVALYAWLESRGHRVVTCASLPKHEVLHWLDLLGEREHQSDTYVVLEIHNNHGVEVKWV